MKKLFILLTFISLSCSAQTYRNIATPFDTLIVSRPVAKPSALVPMTSLSGLSNKTITLIKTKYTGKYTLQNLSNVIIDCNGSTFENATRIIELRAPITNLTIKNFTVQNVSQDYAITTPDYDSNTVIQLSGIKLISVSATNIGQLFHSGSTGLKTGIVKGFELAGAVIKNCPNLSSAIEIRNCWNCSIHDNVIDSVNQLNNNHNSIFFIIGNVRCYNNTLSNHQGNLIRNWPFSHSTKDTSFIYNNLVHDSRRYGAIELQATTGNIGSAFVPADAYVYGNTAYNLDYPNDGFYYSAQMLDLYPTGGFVSYTGNTGRNLYTTDPKYHPITDMINNEGGTANVNTGNKYGN